MARSDAEKIEAARAYAEKEVKRFLASETPSGVGRGPTAYYLWWHLNLSFAEGARGLFIRVSDSAATILCNASICDSDVRDLVADIVATRINNDMPLTDDLKDFAYLALKNALPKPPTKPGTKASQRFERDMFIIWTLENIETRFGAPPTQGDFRGPELPPNGSGILAKAFADAGRHEVTVKVVQEIWFNKKKRLYANKIQTAMLNYKEPPVNQLAKYVASVGN